MIIDILPCVVVTSLETDAFMAIVAFCDMLLVRRNPARGGKEERNSRSSCCSEGKNVQGCESENSDPMNSILRKAGQTRLNASAGHLKFSGCIWYKTEFGKEKGNPEAVSKKVNLMSEILARPVWSNNHLRKRHYTQIASAKKHGFREKTCKV